MTNYLPKAITDLVEALKSLPSVGERTAERYAFYLLRSDPFIARNLSNQLQKIAGGFELCPVCRNYTEEGVCPLCSDNARDAEKICVVAEPLDIVNLEQTHAWHGRYHVLHGLITPLEAITPDDLEIASLVERVKKTQPKEILLALSTDLTGEATAVYIANLLKPLNVKITRLAQGLPQGGEITYTDPNTLTQALKSRQEF